MQPPCLAHHLAPITAPTAAHGCNLAAHRCIPSTGYRLTVLHSGSAATRGPVFLKLTSSINRPAHRVCFHRNSHPSPKRHSQPSIFCLNFPEMIVDHEEKSARNEKKGPAEYVSHGCLPRVNAALNATFSTGRFRL